RWGKPCLSPHLPIRITQAHLQLTCLNNSCPDKYAGRRARSSATEGVAMSCGGRVRGVSGERLRGVIVVESSEGLSDGAEGDGRQGALPAWLLGQPHRQRQ